MSILSISPTRFIASGGKLDSNRRYIFLSHAAPSFVFPVGRTLDLPTRGIVYNLSGVQRIVGTSSGFKATTLPMRV
jgi:hypothetical protein